MLKNNVLRKEADFDNIYKKGKSVGDKYVVVLYIRNRLDLTRTCFLASKKVGNSVKRNRARRLMKESYRQIRENVPAGYDIIIIARTTISGRTFQEVDYSLKRAMKRAGLLPKETI